MTMWGCDFWADNSSEYCHTLAENKLATFLGCGLFHLLWCFTAVSRVTCGDRDQPRMLQMLQYTEAQEKWSL